MKKRLSTNGKKYTILDVAEYAGVSVSVVSNVLNHPEKVAHQTSLAVHKAMQKLEWIPNIRRRGPKNSSRLGVKTGNLALLMMPSVPTHIFMNRPTNTELIYSLIHEANQLGFNLTIIDADPTIFFDANLLARLYDGVLFYGRPPSQKGLTCLSEIAKLLPSIWIHRKTEIPVPINCDYFYYDNREVGSIAEAFFYKKDLKDVSLFTVSSSHVEYMERIASFEEAAKKDHIATQVFSPETVAIEKTTDGSKIPYWNIYHALATAFLETGKSKSLFFCSDDALLGICNELRNLNVNLSDYQLLSCNNNHYLLQYFQHQPASIDICFPKVGAEAIHYLLQIINRKIIPSQKETLIHPVISDNENT